MVASLLQTVVRLKNQNKEKFVAYVGSEKVELTV